MDTSFSSDARSLSKIEEMINCEVEIVPCDGTLAISVGGFVEPLYAENGVSVFWQAIEKVCQKANEAEQAASWKPDEMKIPSETFTDVAKLLMKYVEDYAEKAKVSRYHRRLMKISD